MYDSGLAVLYLKTYPWANPDRIFNAGFCALFKKKIYTHPRLSPYRGATTAAWAWGVAHIDACGMRTCAAGYTAGIYRPAPGVNGHGAEPCSIQHRQVNFYTSKAKRPLQALCVRASEAKRLYLTGNPQRTQVPVRVNRLCNGRGRQPLIFATTT